MKRTLLAVTVVGLAIGLSACGAGRRFWERSDLVAAPAVCTEHRFEIYFAEGQAQLTEPARELIDTTAAALKGCDIRRVQVLGLADATGAPEANLSLSQRRAATVAAAFADAGWPSPVFNLAAAGDRGAVSPTGVEEPLRRRTEVVVVALPPGAR